MLAQVYLITLYLISGGGGGQRVECETCITIKPVYVGCHGCRVC